MRKYTARGAFAITVIAALALTGCGRADDSGTTTDSASTIGSDPATGTVTVWAMGAEGEVLPDFVKAFEDANPDVTVEVTPIPWDAAHNKFQTAIAGGNTPDLAMMGSTWMPDFADAFATVPTDFDTSGFFEGALETNDVGDRLTGVPWYVDTRVLYYRTDLAAQAGWDEAPTSWDELKQLAADLQAKAGAEWGIRLPAGGGDAFQGTLWMPWSNGGSLLEGDAWAVDTPEWVEAYEYYQSYFTEGIATPDVANTKQEPLFVDGSTPMLIDGPFLMGQLSEIGGAGFEDKYTTAVLPANVSSTSFSGGANLVVFEESENVNAAWKLAQWLADPETQAEWFAATGDLPSVEATWDDPALTAEPKLAAFGEQLRTAQSVPATTTWSQVGAAGDVMVEQIARGQKTPQEALAEMQAEADSIGTGDQ